MTHTDEIDLACSSLRRVAAEGRQHGGPAAECGRVALVAAAASASLGALPVGRLPPIDKAHAAVALSGAWLACTGNTNNPVPLEIARLDDVLPRMVLAIALMRPLTPLRLSASSSAGALRGSRGGLRGGKADDEMCANPSQRDAVLRLLRGSDQALRGVLESAGVCLQALVDAGSTGGDGGAAGGEWHGVTEAGAERVIRFVHLLVCEGICSVGDGNGIAEDTAKMDGEGVGRVEGGNAGGEGAEAARRRARNGRHVQTLLDLAGRCNAASGDGATGGGVPGGASGGGSSMPLLTDRASELRSEMQLRTQAGHP